jgi:CBS domain-containing protein
MKSIRDIVVGQNLVTVDGNVPVSDAARTMASRDIGAVPVTDGSRVIGIFSERDALNRVVAAGLDASRTPVRDVMSVNLVAADINEGFEACLNRMRQAHIRHLIVLDGERMAGIISMRDLTAIDLDDKLETITQLNAYVHSVPLDAWNRAT